MGWFHFARQVAAVPGPSSPGSQPASGTLAAFFPDSVWSTSASAEQAPSVISTNTCSWGSVRPKASGATGPSTVWTLPLWIIVPPWAQEYWLRPERDWRKSATSGPWSAQP